MDTFGALHMVLKHKAILAWLLPIFGAAVLAGVAADGTSSAPTVASMDEAFANACLAPYREQLAGWQAADLGEEAYRQAILAARAASADSCSAFVERVGKQIEPGQAEPRALRDARDLLAQDMHDQRVNCLEARAMAEAVRSAESLYQLAYCEGRGYGRDEQTVLLREAAEIDPEHLGALRDLADAPLAAGLDSQQRAEYGASLDWLAEDDDDRRSAAMAIIKGAIDRGDLDAVQQVRESFRQHLLKLPPLSRCQKTEQEIFGLWDACLTALKGTAADALAAGEPLSNELLSALDYLFWAKSLSVDMPKHVRSQAEVAELLATPELRAQFAAAYADEPRVVALLEKAAAADADWQKIIVLMDGADMTDWGRGTDVTVQLMDRYSRMAHWLGWAPWAERMTAQAQQIKAVLESHPEHLRTSRHYLVLARTANSWRERISSLRRAVELDAGNVEARCDIAHSLARVGDTDAARRGYRELLAEGDRSCNAQTWLDELDSRALPEVETLDEPKEFLFHWKH